MTQPQKLKKPGLISRLRSNFFTGLVIVLPVALTIWMIWSFMGFVDNRVLPLVPKSYNPQSYIDFNIRGFGVVFFLLFTTVIGALTKGLFGRSLVRVGERWVDRVPVVRSIYNGAKQLVETITNSTDANFEKACLLQYPRQGVWAIGFISKTTGGEVSDKSGAAPMYSVFLPTTPNPTSGFLLFVPQKDVVVLDMDVETAAKLIISAGIVEPPTAAEIAAGKTLAPKSDDTPTK
ncbi:membrane protein [Amylibacter marinus]|uniref:Membrane protein n=1 Tax=Amylibacter marinus TaxID=1475483 RepID=A0ABQ5VSJ1_9RHOB|nr:DUF502 domain-containing protein [Amylibacter marinus]GLQ34299.1 membrane protein [Amylibacter marinus]